MYHQFERASSLPIPINLATRDLEQPLMGKRLLQALTCLSALLLLVSVLSFSASQFAVANDQIFVILIITGMASCSLGVMLLLLIECLRGKKKKKKINRRPPHGFYHLPYEH